MSAPRSSGARHGTAANTTAAVDAMVATLQHPHVPMIQELRRLIVASDPSVREGVKWNAPSFRTDEYFATLHLRTRPGVGLVLHRGAKARALPSGLGTIDDPDGLLNWLGEDRAMVVFADDAQLQQRAPALQAVLRQWLQFV